MFLFFGNYVVGKKPKLKSIYKMVYESGKFSSEYGEYIYDRYEVHYSEGRSYAETDLFNAGTRKQEKTRADITDEECLGIFGITEGCQYVRNRKPDPGRMDGFMDSSTSRFDIGWYGSPGGSWHLESGADIKSAFIDAVRKAVHIGEDEGRI